MASQLPETKLHPEILALTNKLDELVLKKATPDEVGNAAQKAKAQVMQVTHLQSAPTSWPNISRGKQIYAQNCVTCHGEKADGQGVAATALNPPPISFFDASRMNGLSPFKVFNAIQIGVPGTAMAPIKKISDEDTWAVAFYAMSLRHEALAQQDKDAAQKAYVSVADKIHLEDVASLSDDQLLQSGGSELVVASFRTYSGENDYKRALENSKVLSARFDH